ncbi:MAG: hypothetical protein HOE82_05735 [Gammaproteobacteria bacterium]|jgi:hypothetical protein|nr:hypothetical protein [Gammaproteobacteria bacterium]
MNGKLADFFKRIKESKTIKEKENILNEYKDFFKEYDDYSYLEKSTEDILTDIDTVYNASNRDGA